MNDTTRDTTRLIDDVRGVRYGEVIAVFARHGHFEAEVFGTQFLNDCPQDLWDGLDASAIATELGAFNAHHYRYSPGMSTFLVECDPATWHAYGFADKTIEQSQAICERVFAATLDGHPLVSNKSVWRNFPWIWNERWSLRNMVLIGDALHSAHFSIGSGTRLAIEDAIGHCVDRNRALRVGVANRRTWWVYRYDAVVPGCVPSPATAEPESPGM